MKIWKDEEVKSLFADVEACKNSNRPLRQAFLRHAQAFGRKCNSVRNYYYLEVDNLEKDEPRRTRLEVDLSRHKKAHFQGFGRQNEEELFEKIGALMRGGLSARAACLKISGGNLQLLTRFQNKYQNMKRKLKNAENSQNGAMSASVSSKKIETNTAITSGQTDFEKSLSEKSSPEKNTNSETGAIFGKNTHSENRGTPVLVSDEERSADFSDDLPDNIIPFRLTKKTLTDADINSLFLGLVRLIKKNAREEAARERQNTSDTLLRRAFSDLTKKERENVRLKDDFARLKAENAILRKRLESDLRKNFANLSKNFDKENEKEKIK